MVDVHRKFILGACKMPIRSKSGLGMGATIAEKILGSPSGGRPAQAG
jgi:hypothetical protein